MMHVYVVASKDGAVKVGVSSFPKCRLRQVKYEGYRSCYLYHVTAPHPKARRIETITHELLSAFRLRGEWFNVQPDIAAKAVYQAIEMVESGILSPFGGNTERVRRYKDRQDNAGLARISVRIPIELEPELRRIVSGWMTDKEKREGRGDHGSAD